MFHAATLITAPLLNQHSAQSRSVLYHHFSDRGDRTVTFALVSATAQQILIDVIGSSLTSSIPSDQPRLRQLPVVAVT